MGATVRFVPMDEEEFRASVEQGIVRHGIDMVRRGHWTEADAPSAARAEFALLLPDGRRTANRRFRTIVDAASGERVGETWCTVRTHGGKLQYWIDWLGIDEARRRQGYGRAALRALAEEAAREGAERIGLFVISDNVPARTLYAALGFREESRRLILSVAGSDRAASDAPV